MYCLSFNSKSIQIFITFQFDLNSRKPLDIIIFLPYFKTSFLTFENCSTEQLTLNHSNFYGCSSNLYLIEFSRLGTPQGLE